MNLKQLALAAFTALSPAAQAAPAESINAPSPNTLQTAFQLADQGNNFDDMTREFKTNQLIQDIDDKFQTIIGPIFDLNTTKSHDLYYSYGQNMDIVADIYNHAKIYQIENEEINHCTSHNTQRFFSNYLKEVQSFYTEHPELKTKEIAETIEQTKGQIKELDIENQRIAAQIQIDYALPDSPSKYPCGYETAQKKGASGPSPFT